MLDDKIELNLRSNQNLEALAQGFFRSWFATSTRSSQSAMASRQLASVRRV